VQHEGRDRPEHEGPGHSSRPPGQPDPQPRKPGAPGRDVDRRGQAGHQPRREPPRRHTAARRVLQQHQGQAPRQQGRRDAVVVEGHAVDEHQRAEPEGQGQHVGQPSRGRHGLEELAEPNQRQARADAHDARHQREVADHEVHRRPGHLHARVIERVIDHRRQRRQDRGLVGEEVRAELDNVDRVDAAGPHRVERQGAPLDEAHDGHVPRDDVAAHPREVRQGQQDRPEQSPDQPGAEPPRGTDDRGGRLRGRIAREFVAVKSLARSVRRVPSRGPAPLGRLGHGRPPGAEINFSLTNAVGWR
jgi:hypothetical protein